MVVEDFKDMGGHHVLAEGPGRDLEDGRRLLSESSGAEDFKMVISQ